MTDTLLSADESLLDYVSEMLVKDKRFAGMSNYVTNVNFFWSNSIETACAGHGFIFFNPDFWDRLTHQKKKTVIAHEIWHLMLKHLTRGQDLDPDTYNQAADYVINTALHEDGFDMVGDFGGITPCFHPTKYRGMSTEQVYKLIWEDKKQNHGSHPNGKGGATADQIEELIKKVVAEMGESMQSVVQDNEKAVDDALNHRMPGSEAGADRMLIVTGRVKVEIEEAPYEEIFKDHLTDPLSGGKRTYMRPSRRQMKSGLKLKGKFPKRGKHNRLKHLLYCLDVSGSITHSQRTQFLRSARTLKEKLNPALMTVILWDTSVRFEKTYREDETLNRINVIAGGGTNLSPVYKRAKELCAETVVIFTDLCVHIPPEPEWETIWFATSKSCATDHVSYGKVYLVPKEE